MQVEKTGASIVRKLVEAGYIAYFAGGWVRDLLRGEKSDEIDIATSAPPAIVRELFPKTVAVGISFGVVIVIENNIHFEVSTFRKDHAYEDGRHPEGVDFSNPKEDALRRDFTINGMFYDPVADRIYDYVGGQADLKKRIIRAIGDPEKRFTEDRLRMIRGIRFSARLGFPIEKKTREAMAAHAETLFPSVSVERVWQEFCKMAASPRFEEALLLMHELGLLQVIFPALKDVPSSEMETRVAPIPLLPKKYPPILALLALFPGLDLKGRLAIGRYLKNSQADLKLIEFYHQAELLFQRPKKEVEDVEWAHYYAAPQAELIIDTYAAALGKEREAFRMEHRSRKKRLATHIIRLVTQQPVVSAAALQEEGIAPGKAMGQLLREAEKISINENVISAGELIDRLKKTPLWPK